MDLPSISYKHDQLSWTTMPEDIWIYIIAQSAAKDTLRKTCTTLRNVASSSNEKILVHHALKLSEKALERFVLYHGALGNSVIVRNLLSKGANPNACDDTNISLMHYAAQHGYIDIVDMLLLHPALIKTNIMKCQESPLVYAMRYKQDGVAERIFSKYSIHGGNALCCAIQEGSLNTVRSLLARAINVNSISSGGSYPLCIAAEFGHVHMMKLLIANGANVNYRVKNGMSHFTSLHYATHKGHTNAVQLLIAHGADITIPGGFFCYTPLHYASEEGYVQITEILLENGAHVNEKTVYECTPLDLAKNDVVKQLLIAHGGKTNSELKQDELTRNDNVQPEKYNCVMQ